MKLTGAKMEQKTYQRFSGYVGGLKVIPIAKMMEKHPEHVVTHAVWGDDAQDEAGPEGHEAPARLSGRRSSSRAAEAADV